MLLFPLGYGCNDFANLSLGSLISCTLVLLVYSLVWRHCPRSNEKYYSVFDSVRDGVKMLSLSVSVFKVCVYPRQIAAEFANRI